MGIVINPGGSGSAVGALTTIKVTDAPYNADSSGATTTGTAVQSALDACHTAGGGIVYAPAGTYDCTGTQLSVPIDVELWGAGRQGTLFKWTTDLGAGVYAVSTVDVGATTNAYPAVKGIEFFGPGNEAIALGSVPCNMGGLRLRSNGKVYDCDFHAWNGGINIDGNHQYVQGTRAHHNYFGMYWIGGASSFGDQGVHNCEFTDNRRAAVGVHGDNFIDSCTFSDTHMGFCPYSLYKENSGTYSKEFIVNGTVFNDVYFEQLGNGALFDQGKAKLVQGATFNGTPVIPNATYKIAAEAADYHCVLGLWKDCVIAGTTSFGPGATLGYFDVNTAFNVRFLHGANIIAGITGSKVPWKTANDVRGCELYTSQGARCRFLKLNGAAVPAVNDTVFSGGLNPYSCSGNASGAGGSDLPVGVMQHAGVSGSWSIVAVEGPVTVNANASGITAATWVKADTTTRGKVANGLVSDGGLLVGLSGAAIGVSAAGDITLRCGG